MAAPRDRIRVTWQGTGTSSPITLGGPATVNGKTYLAPSAALNGESAVWLIEHMDPVFNEWELVRGVYAHSGATVARTEIIASTNGGLAGAAVNFSAGLKHVSLVLSETDLQGRFISTRSEAAVDGANDFVAFWDATDQEIKKVRPNNLPSTGGLVLASQAQAEAGTNNTAYMSPLRTAQAIALQASDLSVLFEPGDADLVVDNETISDVIVIYAGSLTADRTVSIDALALPDSGARRILVVHGGATSHAITVLDEGANEAAILLPGEIALLIATAGGVEPVLHTPRTAGALAALDEIGADHLTPGVINNLSTIGSAADLDKLMLWRNSDNELYGITKANLVAGLGGGGGSIQTPVTITGTTHTLQAGNHGKLHIVDNSNGNCAITIPDASAAGTVWRVRSRTTGTLTFQREASGTVNGGTSVTAAGLGREVKIEVESNAGTAPVSTTEGETQEATVQDANHNASGFIIQSHRALVVTGVSGSLTNAAHSGNILVTSGNVTVPNAAGNVGFTAMIIAGGAHTVSFNSTTAPAMASGGVMNVAVQSTTVIKASYIAPGNLVAFS